jgi:hypothetical protein
MFAKEEHDVILMHNILSYHIYLEIKSKQHQMIHLTLENEQTRTPVRARGVNVYRTSSECYQTILCKCL